MRSFDLLFGGYGFTMPLLAGVAIALLAGALSVFVVGRRLAFVGQGISHTAFGGVGLAAVLGLTEAGALTTGGQVLVALFCVGSALLIGAASGKDGHREDTLIGIVLVASMAMGILLYMMELDRNPGVVLPSFESVLFGSFLAIGRTDAIVSWVVCAVVLALIWLWRRPLVFVVFDERGAEAAGVRTGLVRAALMVMLGLAIVLVMKLAGVVLASALLVLPGATADALTKKLRTSFAFSIGLALVGVLAGVVLSFEMDWPTGPSVVVVMVGVYLVARAAGCVRQFTRAGSGAS